MQIEDQQFNSLNVTIIGLNFNIVAINFRKEGTRQKEILRVFVRVSEIELADWKVI
jgi:hypothetical protein